MEEAQLSFLKTFCLKGPRQDRNQKERNGCLKVYMLGWAKLKTACVFTDFRTFCCMYLHVHIWVYYSLLIIKCCGSDISFISCPWKFLLWCKIFAKKVFILTSSLTLIVCWITKISIFLVISIISHFICICTFKLILIFRGVQSFHRISHRTWENWLKYWSYW